MKVDRESILNAVVISIMGAVAMLSSSPIVAAVWVIFIGMVWAFSAKDVVWKDELSQIPMMAIAVIMVILNQYVNALIYFLGVLSMDMIALHEVAVPEGKKYAFAAEVGVIIAMAVLVLMGMHGYPLPNLIIPPSMAFVWVLLLTVYFKHVKERRQEDALDSA